MPLPYSYRGMYAKIVVYNPDLQQKQEFDIGQTIDDANSTFLPYFVRMTVLQNVAGGGTVTVVLAPPRWVDFVTLVESPWVRKCNTLSVQWGYTDDPTHISPWIHMMMDVPDLSIDGSEFSVTLNGKDFSYPLKTNGSLRVWSTEEHKRSLQSVFTEIAQKYGLTILVNEGNPLPDLVNKAWTSPRSDLIQSGENDWMWMQLHANRMGCQLYMKHGFILHLYKGSKPAAPSVCFLPFGITNPVDGILPMWGYSTEIEPLTLPGRGVAVTHYGFNAQRTQPLTEALKTKTQAKVLNTSALSVSSIPSTKGAIDASAAFGPISLQQLTRNLIDTTKASNLTMVRSQSDEASMKPDIDANPDTGGAKTSAELDDAAGGTEEVKVASQEPYAHLMASGRSDLNARNHAIKAEFDSIDYPILELGAIVSIGVDPDGTLTMPEQYSGNHSVLEVEHRVGRGDFGTMHVKVGLLSPNQKFELDGMSQSAAKSQEDQPTPSDNSTAIQPDPGAGV